MTPGTSGEAVDGMSLGKIERIIRLLTSGLSLVVEVDYRSAGASQRWR